ncbi:MAG: PDZ domain-containing protein, partial [Gemmatimonadales bacterium]
TVQETRSPRIGVGFSEARDGGLLVAHVEPNSLASEAGLQPGDLLTRIGDVSTSDPQNFGAQYRNRYGSAEGMPIVLSWVRGGQQMTGRGTVRLVTEHSYEVARDPNASAQARAILDGILGQGR